MKYAADTNVEPFYGMLRLKHGMSSVGYSELTQMTSSFHEHYLLHKIQL